MKADAAKRRIRRARILCGLAAGAGLLMALYTYMAVRPTGYRELEKRVEARAQTRRERLREKLPPVIRQVPSGETRAPAGDAGESKSLTPPGLGLWELSYVRQVGLLQNYGWSATEDGRDGPNESSADLERRAERYLRGAQHQVLFAGSRPDSMRAEAEYFAHFHEYFIKVQAAGLWQDGGIYDAVMPGTCPRRWQWETGTVGLIAIYLAAESRHDEARRLFLGFIEDVYFHPDADVIDLEDFSRWLLPAFQHLLAWGVISIEEARALRDALEVAMPRLTMDEESELRALRRIRMHLETLSRRESIDKHSVWRSIWGGVPHAILHPLLLPLAEREIEAFGVAEAVHGHAAMLKAGDSFARYAAGMSLNWKLFDHELHNRGRLDQHQWLLEIQTRELQRAHGSLRQRDLFFTALDFMIEGEAAMRLRHGSPTGGAVRRSIHVSEVPRQMIASLRNWPTDAGDILRLRVAETGRWPASWEDLGHVPAELRADLYFAEVEGATLILVEEWLPARAAEEGWRHIWEEAELRNKPEQELRVMVEEIIASSDEVHRAAVITIPNVPTREEFLRLIGPAADSGAVPSE